MCSHCVVIESTRKGTSEGRKTNSCAFFGGGCVRPSRQIECETGADSAMRLLCGQKRTPRIERKASFVANLNHFLHCNYT